MSVFKIAVGIIGLGFILGVGWMNLTPGYFRLTGCPCQVVHYRTDVLEFPCLELTEMQCKRRMLDSFKLLLANLDFNR